MKTKTIFKALALAMLMPAMLLTTACSSDDAIVNNDNTNQNGYPLPVTVNVTRQGDNTTTRATYTDNGNKTGSLSFSSGDQLFVSGNHATAGKFAGTLNYVSEGTFSGTINTEEAYSDADALFKSADVTAELLPNGYGTYGYFSIIKTGYEAYVHINYNNAFATTKALAVEQFSDEYVDSYSNGFALRPLNAILNFTITGLTANATDVAVSFTSEYATISGSVNANSSGTATFAIGVEDNTNLNNCSLTVGGNAITLPTNTLTAGKIYNITRSAVTALNLTSPAVGQVIGDDGKNYDYASLPGGVTAVAKICYVSGSNGLALALADEVQMDWSTAITTCAAHTPAFTGGTWKLATQDEWTNMITAAGSYTALRDGFSSVGGSNLQSSLWSYYWSSTGNDSDTAWFYDFNKGNWFPGVKDDDGVYVRACLAF